MVSILISATPVFLAALGGLFSLKANVLNITLEGNMTLGAFIMALLLNQNVPTSGAMGAALLAGIAMGMLLALVHIKGGAHLFIAGLGINLLAPALTGWLSMRLLGHQGMISTASVQTFRMFPVAVVGVPGATVLAHLILFRSDWGRQIRACGQSPGFLRERGGHPERIQTAMLAISSGLAAMAGALLMLRLGAWVPGISAGRGWIALVVIWLGGQRPLGLALAACFFSFMEAASGWAQASMQEAVTLMLAIPYLGALVALVAASLWQHSEIGKRWAQKWWN